MRQRKALELPEHPSQWAAIELAVLCLPVCARCSTHNLLCGPHLLNDCMTATWGWRAECHVQGSAAALSARLGIFISAFR